MSEHNSTDDLQPFANGHNGAGLDHSVPRSGPSHVSVAESLEAQSLETESTALPSSAAASAHAAEAALSEVHEDETHTDPYGLTTPHEYKAEAENHTHEEHGGVAPVDEGYDNSYTETYTANGGYPDHDTYHGHEVPAHEDYALDEAYPDSESKAAAMVRAAAVDPDISAVPELAPLAGGGWDEPPSNGHYDTDIQPWQPPEPYVPPRDKEQDLFEHLTELRARLLACVYAIGAAMVITWNYNSYVEYWMSRPLMDALAKYKLPGNVATHDLTEGLMIYFQMSFASGLLIAMPVVLYQLWRFVEPALTHHERRYTVVLVPFSIGLFCIGVTLGYVMSPMFFQFFLQYQPPGAIVNFSYQSSVIFLAKVLLVFGICFQVPVVTIFVNKIGLVSRNWMIEYWRHVFVAIFTIVAIITPTWDPITLFICALPPCFLYLLSIWLVKWL